ncbi:MAG TPA: sugar kinase [Balneolaceae bacterium]|nr:sugar kinase [Balneolaceae bacterium]
MGNIVTFGEIMLRLSPPGYSRFIQTNQFEVTYGGGEANVAVALAGYEMNSFFVTRLPGHEIGEAALHALQRYGVNTQHIIRGGDRLGIYFLETGASQRPSKVIYDRANSAVEQMEESMVNWDKVFQDKDWFHWTGITPALGEKPRKSVIAACKAAKSAGVTISCDLNFRGKLWSEQEAQAVMNPLMEYVDVCICNEEDAQKSLGFEAGRTNIEGAELDEEGYFTLARSLKKEYEFQSVAITLRESYSASRNGWSALLHDERDCKQPVRSARYEIDIVDRVGGGDSFASGLIYGLLTKSSTIDALEFAVAASCLKHTIPGDFNLVRVDEVEKLIQSGGSGRVER